MDVTNTPQQVELEHDKVVLPADNNSVTDNSEHVINKTNNDDNCNSGDVINEASCNDNSNLEGLINEPSCSDVISDAPKESLYDELIKMDDNNINANNYEFDCPICLEVCKPGEGVLLIDCLHNFCKNCLIGHIEASTECEIKCPFIDNLHSCESIIQHCEIKELVSTQTYERMLEKSVVQAELKIKTLVQCKTNNCPGYYDVGEELDSFSCQICNALNCIKCNAIHKHLTCAEYRQTLNDPDIYTREEIDTILREKRGMPCPACGILIMKTDGCDGVRCTRCNTEICWATRGPRWGPRGNGDTSGGCRCSNNKRCHPDCSNCH